MAIESVPSKPTTIAVEFGFSPAEDNSLFEVRDGLPIRLAVSSASCLEDSVQHLLNKAVEHEGLSPQAAFLCEFAMDAAKALRTSAGQEV